MKSNKFYRLLIAMLLVLSLALVACNKDDDDGEASGGSEDPPKEEEKDDEEEEEEEEEEPEYMGEVALSQFAQTVSNTAEPMEGGELNYGLVSANPFTGTLNWNFYSGNPDSLVLAWFDESLIHIDPATFLYTQEGAATWEHDDSGKVFTFTIRDGVNWHDGTPVTAEDWEFAHYVIADPDYTAPRFDSSLRNVEGIEEYNRGEADTISGIEVIDEKTLQITYKESTPSLLAGGIWTYPLAKHIFEDIPVADMESSPEVREHPIGFGPYKVDVIVPGESVTYTKNEDYWRGEPALDKVTLKVIAPATVAQAIATGEVDLVDSFPADQYPDNADLTNVEFLASYANYFSYIGFKLGDWDAENAEVVQNRETPLQDKALRQAMALAIDGDTVGQEFYNGLHWGANSIIDPGHALYYDQTWEGYEYDPEEANAILDEAGYTERDANGFRLDLDGNEMVFQYAGMDRGDEISEPMANFFLQQWAEIGINVELYNGRLLPFDDFYDRVGDGEEDDLNIDIFQGAWGTGSDVDKLGLFGKNAKFNFSRWDNEESEELLQVGLSEEAFDVDFRRNAYLDWHNLMVEEVPVMPLTHRLDVIPANKRVVNYSVDPENEIFRYQWGVSSDTPEVN